MPNPGSPEQARAVAAPSSTDGKIGPPRRDPSAMPQASPLHATSATSAPTDQACGCAASWARVAWPDSAASAGLRPVISAYAATQTPTAVAQATVRAAVRCRVQVTVRRPSARASVTRTAIRAAVGSPHRKSPASGPACGGRSGRDSAPIFSPVHCPKPVKTRAPVALASRQGSSRATSWVPASPAPSMSRTAAAIGPPRMVEIAAVEPAVARIALAR